MGCFSAIGTENPSQAIIQKLTRYYIARKLHDGCLEGWELSNKQSFHEVKAYT